MVKGKEMKELTSKLKILVHFSLITLFLLSVIFSFYSYRGKNAIVIGAKNNTEQHILGEILAQLIENRTNLKVIRKFNFEGTTICFNALKSKAIDVYFEYTGTALLDILKESPIQTPLLPYLKTAFSEKYNLLWLDPLGFSNHYVLATRPDTQLKKISDLQKNPDVKIAIDPEFASRLEYTLLQKSYPMQWQSKLMDQVLLYFSLKNKTIDVISTYSTDGRIQGKEFVILQDDKGCLPNYEVAPLVLKSSLSKHPELYSVFALLKEAISEEEISHLNYQVEFLRKDIKGVVVEFLKSAKMLL